MIKTIRTVMGIRGEPSTPDDPARGLAWSAILTQIDQPGSQSEFVSVADSQREMFRKHPWSIGGGGAAELKESLDESADTILGDRAESLGILMFTLEDDVFSRPLRRRSALRIPRDYTRPILVGTDVRDWIATSEESAIFPYDDGYAPLALSLVASLYRWLWPCRTSLSNNMMFGGKTKVDAGLKWYEYGRLTHTKLRTPLTIVWANVATHNHFVVDLGGSLFNVTACIAKLKSDATEGQHHELVAVLNSSIGAFWMKQVLQTKGSSGIGRGVYDEGWEKHYQFDGTKLKLFPVPAGLPSCLAASAGAIAQRWSQHAPSLLTRSNAPSTTLLNTARQRFQELRQQMIALQEEIDWWCYRAYGLIDEDLCYRGESLSIDQGQRAFEIAMARKIATGELQTTWFDRHGSTPITELPANWPEDYRRLVERRIGVIETEHNIALIDKPEYKRRWNTESWESQVECALRCWLLDRLESYFDFDGRMNDEGKPTAKLDVALTSVARLADVARQDPDFMQVGELYRNDPAFDVQRLVAELVEAESVPLLPVLRYKATGLRKRAEWEKTWDLQRRQDELAADRKEAMRAIRQERERVAKSLAAEKAEVDALRAALWKECIEVRDRFARGFELPQNADADAEIAVRILGQHGVAIDGGNALKDLQAKLERVEKKVTEFEIAVGKLCQTDAAYQAAAARYAAIPPDPDIDVPPKYTSADFLKSDHWQLRGKLDVPKERWVSFPHCEGPDGTLVIAWAGYDHLQLARAISAYYVDIQERLGGRDDPRLIPLLACLLELLPWVKQWHNEPDAAFDGLRMGDYFEGFINEEARQLGKTVPEIKAWQPPKRGGRRSLQ